MWEHHLIPNNSRLSWLIAPIDLPRWEIHPSRSTVSKSSDLRTSTNRISITKDTKVTADKKRPRCLRMTISATSLSSSTKSTNPTKTQSLAKSSAPWLRRHPAILMAHPWDRGHLVRAPALHLNWAKGYETLTSARGETHLTTENCTLPWMMTTETPSTQFQARKNLLWAVKSNWDIKA